MMGISADDVYVSDDEDVAIAESTTLAAGASAASTNHHHSSSSSHHHHQLSQQLAAAGSHHSSQQQQQGMIFLLVTLYMSMIIKSIAAHECGEKTCKKCINTSKTTKIEHWEITITIISGGLRCLL